MVTAWALLSALGTCCSCGDPVCFPHPPFIISPRLLLSMHLAHRSTSLDSMSHALCIPSPLGIDTAPCLGETTAARALLDRAASLFFHKENFPTRKTSSWAFGGSGEEKTVGSSCSEIINPPVLFINHGLSAACARRQALCIGWANPQVRHGSQQGCAPSDVAAPIRQLQQ